MDLETDFPVPTFQIIYRLENDSAVSDADELAPDETPAAIFTKDPAEWLRFVDHSVEITLDNGVVKTGVVHVIDPVSEAVVLVKKDAANGRTGKKLAVEIIPGHVIEKMSIVSKADPDLLRLVNEALSDGDASAPSLSDEEVIARRDEVRNWLSANRIPVEIGGIKGDVIEVAGKALIIKPPYDVDNCFSLNEIILKKVQALLTNRKVS